MYIDWKALLLAVLFVGLLLFIWRRQNRAIEEPTLFVSNVDAFKTEKEGWRTRFSFLPSWALYTALAFFSLAFLDPHTYVSKQKENAPLTTLPTKGIAIYLVLDRSGSMAQEVPAPQSELHRVRLPKIELLREVTKQFVEGRKSDLVGLVAFARTANVLVPLTLDHQTVLEQLAHVDTVKSIDEDGTAMGYAIYKTASLIVATRHYAMELSAKGEVPPYQIKNSVILVVTDGFQDPNPKDAGSANRMMGIEQAAEYAKKEDIRLYVVNVDPAFSTEEFAPHRRQMQRITELTGGKFYLVDSATSLNDIYHQIDQIEKSILPAEVPKSQQPQLYTRISFYPYLIALGLCFYFIALLLQTTILRKMP